VTAGVDEIRLEELMHRLIGFLTGSAVCYGIWLGDELGLYRVLAADGPARAAEAAARANCNPRLVREWLDGQAACGLITYDAAADTYGLSAEAVMALADDASPVFTPGP
jgi:hypothetical protein